MSNTWFRLLCYFTKLMLCKLETSSSLNSYYLARSHAIQGQFLKVEDCSTTPQSLPYIRGSKTKYRIPFAPLVCLFSWRW